SVAKKPSGGALDIALPHQALAYEKCGHTETSEARQVFISRDSALRDDELGLRNSRRKALGDGEIRDKRVQVPIVDSDHRGLEREGAIKLALVVNLDQSIEVPFLCRFEQAAGLGIVHTRENHEYAIRPQGSCLDYLIRIEHEILAQHGQRGCSS